VKFPKIMDKPDTSYFYSVAVAALLTSGFFFTHWALLPDELRKSDTASVKVFAEYVPSKIGRRGMARFKFPNGDSTAVSCGRAIALCARLEQHPLPDLTIWLSNGVLGEEPWVVAAENANETLLNEARQNIVFAEFKPKNAFISGALAAVAAIAIGFASVKKSTKPR
jgi:hypothetical protein